MHQPALTMRRMLAEDLFTRALASVEALEDSPANTSRMKNQPRTPRMNPGQPKPGPWGDLVNVTENEHGDGAGEELPEFTTTDKGLDSLQDQLPWSSSADKLKIKIQNLTGNKCSHPTR